MLPIEINGPLIGIYLKELVRRAMVTINNERFTFEATGKAGYDGSMDDVFTSADTAAQKVFEDSILEALPGVGLIGEEGLRVPCTLKSCNAYITIDPLDGTKAFVRRQSHGVATMVALVIDGNIVSAWIGDVNTQEIYGYRPGSNKVHRINQLERSQYLHGIDRTGQFAEQYALLREPLEKSPPEVVSAISSFKKYHIDGGSIGTWFTKLWKGEYAAVVTDPGHETPWDSAPVIGISQKLGFKFLRPSPRNAEGWEVFNPVISEKVYPRDHWTIVMHESQVAQFLMQ